MQKQTKAENSAHHPPPRSGLVQLLSEPPQAQRYAGRLISLDGSNQKVKFVCNIRVPPKAACGGGLSP
jgi:hypothetical protein